MQRPNIKSTKRYVQRASLSLLIAAILISPLFAAGIRPALAAGDSGAVYVQSNASSGNEILVFDRNADGSLSDAGAFSTGGLGTGSGLGSQGALSQSSNGRWLIAVNAGSNEVSNFRIRPDGLQLTEKISSGGELPISLTTRGNLLYVLNAGGSGNITGFSISGSGKLNPLAGSTRHLSNGGVGAAPGPAQISFSPNGQLLVVTEKASNLILTYPVGADGLAGDPVATPSAGETPFGFDFSRRNTLIVSEAFGGATDASVVSSYALDSGDIQVISPAVPTTETAACWVVVTNNGKFAYVTNTGSGTVSGYQVRPDGSLRLLDADGVTGITGPDSSPIDVTLSPDNRFLYVLNAGTHTVAFFEVGSGGSLTHLGEVSVPAGSVGIAAQ
jgi:6-phosphogluconolactonase (cycloisomerase 2 family)